jgi:hypothetical protein
LRRGTRGRTEELETGRMQVSFPAGVPQGISRYRDRVETESWTIARTELRGREWLVNGSRQGHLRSRHRSMLTCCREGRYRSVRRPSRPQQRGRSHKEAAREVSESLLRFFSRPGSSVTPGEAGQNGMRGFISELWRMVKRPHSRTGSIRGSDSPPKFGSASSHSMT